MKFQIGINIEHDPNYVLIDPEPKEGNPQFTGNLDELPCEDGECTEILAPRFLDFIGMDVLPHVLESWLKKMRKSGTIILGGTDLMELSTQVSTRQLNSAQFNGVISGKNAIHSCIDVCDLLEAMELTIKKRYYHGLEFVIEFGKK